MRLLSVKAFNACGEARTFDVLTAIRYAVDAGAQVLNMSFAGSPPEVDPAALQVAIDYAVARRVVPVAAAGNGALNLDLDPQYPAASAGVIAVGALDYHADGRAFSNVGAAVALAAPGQYVYSTTPTYQVYRSDPSVTDDLLRRNYDSLSGTSMAAPHVAGAVALMVERAPALTVAAVREGLQRTAADLGAPGQDRFTGAGLLQVEQAATTGTRPGGPATPRPPTATRTPTPTWPPTLTPTPWPTATPWPTVTPSPTPRARLQQLALRTSSLVYNRTRGRLVAGLVGATAVAMVDPVSGAVEPLLSVGGAPHRLAVSDAGRTLYVGLADRPVVRRIDLDTRQSDLEFVLGSDPTYGAYYADDLAVLPGQSAAVVVSRRRLGITPRFMGTVVYDDGVPRSSIVTGHGGPVDLVVGASAAVLYGQNTESSSADIYRMAVTAEGLTTTAVSAPYAVGGTTGGHLAHVDGRLYTDAGVAVDPTSLTVVARFGVAGPIAVDPVRRRAYIVEYDPHAIHRGEPIAITVFDLDTARRLDTVTLWGISGRPLQLLSLGSARLALRVAESLHPPADRLLLIDLATTGTPTTPTPPVSPTAGATATSTPSLTVSPWPTPTAALPPRASPTALPTATHGSGTVTATATASYTAPASPTAASPPPTPTATATARRTAPVTATPTPGQPPTPTPTRTRSPATAAPSATIAPTATAAPAPTASSPPTVVPTPMASPPVVGPGPAPPTLGATDWYFAEGWTGPGFDQYLTIQNPNPTAAAIEITYFLTGALPVTRTLTVVAASRFTVVVHEEAEGVGRGQAVSARVRSTNGVGIVVERPLYFTYGDGITGGHTVMGVQAPRKTWLFAEGWTGAGFDEYLTLLNPHAEDAPVTITYFLGGGQAPLVKTLIVPRSSRATVAVHEEREGVGRDQAVSARVETTLAGGIVVERPIYFRYTGSMGTVTGGHTVMGASAPRAVWHFPDGDTRPGVDEYLTLLNSSDAPARVRLTYYVDGLSAPQTREVDLPPTSRTTIAVHATVHGVGRGQRHGTTVEALTGVGIVAERPVYVRYGVAIDGGHDVMSAPASALTWHFAEGYTGSGFDLFLVILNPNAAPASVTITYQTAGGAAPLVRTLTVAPAARAIVAVHAADQVGRGQEVSATVRVTAGPGIVVERPSYFVYRGAAGAVDGSHTVLGYTGEP